MSANNNILIAPCTSNHRFGQPRDEIHHEKGGLYQVQAWAKTVKTQTISASGVLDEKITMPYENESVFECELMVPSRPRV